MQTITPYLHHNSLEYLGHSAFGIRHSAFGDQSYADRAQSLSHNEQLKITLSNVIDKRMHVLEITSFDQLDNDDFRQILDDLHERSSESQREILNQAGFKTVSTYSLYSNERARDKIVALKALFLNQPKELDKFISEEFYSFPIDEKKGLFYITPTQSGCELLIQYYHEKYDTQIITPKQEDNTKIASWLFQNQTIGVDQIQQVREKAINKDNYRQAFFFGPDVEAHSTPIIYIKENGEEAIFIADSIGGKNESRLSNAIADFIYADGKKIPVYAVKNGRQADTISCFMDALIFGRDTTSVNKSTGNYYIPELLKELKSKRSESGNHFSVLLPDQLLKTAQLSAFVNEHQHADKPIIHKNKTLQQFRDANSQFIIAGESKSSQKNETTAKPVSTYVRRKGINSADQIEIQFYLNQLEKQAGGQLPDKEKIRFIAGARKELRRQLNLSQKEKNSEVNLSKENFTTREGLHTWVIRWAEKEAHIKKHPAYLL